MKIEVTDKEIIIHAPRINEVSKSGKSLLLATSRGNLTTSEMVDGKPVVVGLNVYVSK